MSDTDLETQELNYPDVQWNKFMLMGTVTGIDERERGSAMVFVKAGGREEVEVKNTPIPTWFTPIIAVRVPTYVLEKIGPDVLQEGNLVVVEGRLQGVKRNVDKKDFFIVEAQASRISDAVKEGNQ